AEDDEASEYEDDSCASSGNECEHEAPQSNRTSALAEKSTKPRRKLAHTAREYVARLHEQEDQKHARKMKQGEGKKQSAKRLRKRKLAASDSGPSKAIKTANGNSYLLADGSSSSSTGRPLLPAESIKAKTHTDQMAQLKASIPQNCDTRRKNTQKQDLDEAVKIFGYKKIEADDGDWRLKGMKTAMRCHQITAVAWMIKRELARMQPFGGLLADAMGMGKTIMSLACILGNPPDDEHIAKYCKATLVVVPSKAVAQQWEAEARRHYNEPHSLRAFIYDRQCEDLHQRCTQSLIEVMMQYPDNTVIRQLAEKYDTDDISYHRALDEIVGILFRINWYRVILDEAHAIKNAESRTSKACCALYSKYRWALSGTPLSNSSYEMYPYMKFTQCEWTATQKDFRAMFFIKTEPNAQFEALTSLIMYRRTMDDSFFGRQIISLPDRNEVDLWIPMSAEEHFVVSAVNDHYKKLRARIESGTLGEGDLKDINDAEGEDATKEQRNNENRRRKSAPKERSPRKASYLLTHASQVRSRQSTSHVFCIERLLRQNFCVEELGELKENLGKIDKMQTILEQMQLDMKADDEIAKYRKGLEILQEREETYFGKFFDMEPLLNLLAAECSTRDVTCLLCNTEKPPVDPIFSYLDCPYKDCNQKLGSGPDIKTIQKILKQSQEKNSGYSEPAKDSLNASVHHDDERNGFFVASTFRGDIPILPSTKLTATMAVVLTWMDEAPDDKILSKFAELRGFFGTINTNSYPSPFSFTVFTQFIGTAKMLGLMLQTLNIGFVYYYGGLASAQKARALETIKTRNEIKVMVSTLKSGGQSLNLTAANRVIIIDPWWNKTAEQQAFGRVVRIGQQKVTHLVNIKTKEPIDKRIYDLQTKKARDVDRTLQDDGHTPQITSEAVLRETFLRVKEE
ncbi:hypothetical protein TRIATDRAFT_162130, partial [Trichoderma atroviride IMI 206040]